MSQLLIVNVSKYKQKIRVIYYLSMEDSMKTLKIDKVILEVVNSYGKKKEYLLAILQDIVKKKGYLTEDSILNVAQELKISPNEVYSVATFYSFIKTKPVGKYVIRVCNTISCDLAGKDAIIDAIVNELRISVGSTTSDQLFTLELTNCIGMCDQGPAMLINDTVYSKLDPNKAVEIIREYKNKN